METLLQDVRFGLRTLRSNPGVTAVAVVTLALGIAANTTIFSAVNGWMLRPPRIKDPAGVVVVVTVDPAKGPGWGWDRQPVSAYDFVAWREQSHAFEGMVASEWSQFALTGTGEPERLIGIRASASYFDLLGVSAALGRTFLPGEDQPGRAQVVILSHGLWKRRFGSNPRVVGEVVRLNGESHTVVGVMPNSYRLGLYGPQLWTPLVFPPESILPAARGNRSLEVLARLKSGVSIETAKAEMAALAQRSEQTYPDMSKGWSAAAMSIQHYIADEFRIGMRLQMGVVIFVLLIACANIASLQLARAAGRQREFTVRAALGASRFRLARQLLVESLLIALAGGGLGLLLASWGVDLFRRGLSSSAEVRSIAHEVTIDHTVLIFTLGISVLAAILFGLAPAFQQTALNLQSNLKEGGRSSSQSRARHRTHSVLVTGEIALALVLLIGAGFFAQEFLDKVHAGFGIDPNQVLTADISLSSARYKDPSKQAAFFQEAIQRLEALPGVISAGATTLLAPGLEGVHVVTFSIESRPAMSRTERARTDYFAISPDYLHTLRVPLVRGRNFLPSDTAPAPPVALVNQAFARRYFPNDEPIGKRIRLDTIRSDRPDWSEIVGVVGNVRDSLERRSDMPQTYEPYPQRPSSRMTLIVRTSFDPAAFAPMLRRAVWGVDKDQPITAVQTMNQLIAQSGANGRLMNILMGTFAGLGLALAAVGVFGVTSYTVAQRTHEIGIRMALGAQSSDVLRMVVKKGMVLGALGVGIGLALAAPLVWLKLGLVYDDELLPFGQRAPIFLAAVFLMSFVALLASYIPARRATKVDPMVALRCE